MEESKVLSYYGFGSAGGPADMAVIFGEVDDSKTDKVRRHFGSADPGGDGVLKTIFELCTILWDQIDFRGVSTYVDKQWLSLVVSHGGNRQHLVMKPGHPVFMFQTGVFNHTQVTSD